VSAAWLNDRDATAKKIVGAGDARLTGAHARLFRRRR
jgi:hypothetical protein